MAVGDRNSCQINNKSCLWVPLLNYVSAFARVHDLQRQNTCTLMIGLVFILHFFFLFKSLKKNANNAIVPADKEWGGAGYFNPTAHWHLPI